MSDLWKSLDQLYTKEPFEEGAFPRAHTLHRFLAHDRTFATFAKHLQREVRENDLMIQCWRGLLPRGRGCPDPIKYGYVAPKKPPKMEALIAQIVARTHESRQNVEEMVAIVIAAGKEARLYSDFPVSEKDIEKAMKGRTPPPPPAPIQQGLLA